MRTLAARIAAVACAVALALCAAGGTPKTEASLWHVTLDVTNRPAGMAALRAALGPGAAALGDHAYAQRTATRVTLRTARALDVALAGKRGIAQVVRAVRDGTDASAVSAELRHHVGGAWTSAVLRGLGRAVAAVGPWTGMPRAVAAWAASTVRKHPVDGHGRPRGIVVTVLHAVDDAVEHGALGAEAGRRLEKLVGGGPAERLAAAVGRHTAVEQVRGAGTRHVTVTFADGADESEVRGAVRGAVLSALGDPSVVRVALRPDVRTLNRYTHGVLQSHSLLGGVDNANSSTPFVEPSLNSGDVDLNGLYGAPTNTSVPGVSARVPYFAQGLDGSGEVIAIADTGLDTSHCLFSDGGASPGPGNRKVVSVESFVPDGDKSDVVSGHGTHVAGIAAGLVDPALAGTFPGMAWYSGSAPGARIAMQDLATPKEAAIGVLSPPDDLGVLFLAAQEQNASVHSNSWGGPAQVYSVQDAFADAYLYKHPELLVAFAAGNSGGGGFFTTGSPSTAKNVMAVGALQSTPFSAQDIMMRGNTVMITGGTTAAIDGTYAFGLSMTAYLNDWARAHGQLLGDSLAGFVVRVGSGCDGTPSAPQNTSLLHIAVFDYSSSSCGSAAKFISQVSRTISVGYDMVVVGANAPSRNDPLIIALVGTEDMPRPLRVVDNAVIRDLGDNTNVVVTVNGTVAGNSSWTPERVAFFSSRGPTFDGRIGAEISAPGFFLVSARSSGGQEKQPTCGISALTPKAGTSMATPAAAGAMLLLRQALRTPGAANVTQYLPPYPVGAGGPVDTSLFNTLANTTSDLLRGLAAGGGMHVETLGGQTGERARSLPEGVNLFAGFGQLELSRAVPLAAEAADSTLGSRAVWMTNRGVVNPGGSLGDQCWAFSLSGVSNAALASGTLTATLVWLDEGAAEGADQPLVRDLDLYVYAAGGARLIGVGNQRVAAELGKEVDVNTTYLDRRNTVERVRVALGAGSVESGGTVVVRVSADASRPFDGAQRYALVVHGPQGFVHVEPTSTPTDFACGNSVLRCPDDCGEHGRCDAQRGGCVCEAGRYGLGCQYQVRSGGSVKDGTLTFGGTLAHTGAWDIVDVDVSSLKDRLVTAIDAEPIAFSGIPESAADADNAMAMWVTGASGGSAIDFGEGALFGTHGGELEFERIASGSGELRVFVNAVCCDLNTTIPYSVKVHTTSIFAIILITVIVVVSCCAICCCFPITCMFVAVLVVHGRPKPNTQAHPPGRPRGNAGDLTGSIHAEHGGSSQEL